MILLIYSPLVMHSLFHINCSVLCMYIFIIILTMLLYFCLCIHYLLCTLCSILNVMFCTCISLLLYSLCYHTLINLFTVCYALTVPYWMLCFVHVYLCLLEEIKLYIYILDIKKPIVAFFEYKSFLINYILCFVNKYVDSSISCQMIMVINNLLQCKSILFCIVL